jgi:hypothetical protein
MPIGDGFDIGDFDVGGIHQSVDPSDARLGGDAPTDIECGASGGRDGHAVDQLHLSGVDVVAVHHQHRRLSSVPVDQLRGQARLYPLATQHRSGRQVGDHAPASRPQPRGARPLSSGKLDTAQNVYVGIHRNVEPTQLADG